MRVLVCIPARYDSTRFPGKVLASDTGKYLIQHTYEQACKAKLPSAVLITADDEKILTAARTFGAPCVLTSKDHQSGTDRISEAVADTDIDIVVNLQADEPEIDPNHIDQVAELLISGQDSGLRTQNNVVMSTLAAPLTDREQIADPNIVKVITDIRGRALYFSRYPVPYDRDSAGIGATGTYLRHIGMYAFTKDFLLTFPTLEQSPLEKAEKLEQLRALENGFGILVGRVESVADGIDTPQQYAAFVKRIKQRK